MQGSQIPRIMYSCYSQLNREGENFIDEHVFSYVIAGIHKVFLNGKTYTYHEGDFRFFSRNQLAKFVKIPPTGGEFNSISVRMDRTTLVNFSAEHNIRKAHPYHGENAVLLEPNDLLHNYINSLKPYFDDAGQKNKALTTMKVKEAIMILLETDPALKNLLFDFSEPGKADLISYMNQNYKFNVNIERFAYLTRRSLATFKRDFKQASNVPPHTWLLQKRLEEAHRLLSQNGLTVSEVYQEVGFIDITHFSYAFKKAYGIAPSMLNHSD